MNVRVGEKVCVIHHMSNRGIVKEVYQVPVSYGASGGTFSKRIRVKFLSYSLKEL